jgi:hypothetical protein
MAITVELNHWIKSQTRIGFGTRPQLIHGVATVRRIAVGCRLNLQTGSPIMVSDHCAIRRILLGRGGIPVGILRSHSRTFYQLLDYTLIAWCIGHDALNGNLLPSIIGLNLHIPVSWQLLQIDLFPNGNGISCVSKLDIFQWGSVKDCEFSNHFTARLRVYLQADLRFGGVYINLQLRLDYATGMLLTTAVDCPRREPIFTILLGSEAKLLGGNVGTFTFQKTPILRTPPFYKDLHLGRLNSA